MRTGTQNNGSKLDLVILLLVAAVIYTALLTIPVGSTTKDIYVDMGIKKPLVGNVEFTDTNAFAQPHTLLSVPAMGNILTSGTVKVTAQTASMKTQITVGEIGRASDTTARIVLKDVPINENEVTLKLYEDNSLAQTMKVVIS